MPILEGNTIIYRKRTIDKVGVDSTVAFGELETRCERCSYGNLIQQSFARCELAAGKHFQQAEP